VKNKHGDGLTDFLFLLPTGLLLSVFVFYPFIVGFVYSFSDWNGLFVSNWIGFGNYRRIFNDMTVRAAFQNTLMYGFCVPVVVLPVGMLLANILNSRRLLKGGGIFRTIVYLPATVSLVIVANIFNIILVYEGAVDQLWMFLGNSAGLNVMASGAYMRIAMIAIMIWCGLGGCVVFLLAGLQGIPKELFEAAYADGANATQCFFKITLPLMRPTVMIVMFILMNSMLKTFDLPYKMSQGGPGNATVSIGLLIYNQIFKYTTVGYATTTGLILLIVVSILAYLQMRITGGREDTL
jgi:ABC-type sugar transport system permease subunit